MVGPAARLSGARGPILTMRRPEAGPPIKFNPPKSEKYSGRKHGEYS
jgi:hypothetical protein